MKQVDYYFVTEFQIRGSEHEHGLVWVENASIYGVNSNTDIGTFFDNYLTCSTYHLDPELAKIHEHHHIKSCKKRNISHCRYNFPMLPMRSTQFIEPIVLVDDTMNERVKLISGILETIKYDSNSGFDDFLDDIHLIEYYYIITIQSTLKQLMILLEGNSYHIWNNNICKEHATIMECKY